ncbi:MAG: transposase [Proteobacteria bacterium]|nr:transposase [Pseudomonadota bacterium]
MSSTQRRDNRREQLIEELRELERARASSDVIGSRLTLLKDLTPHGEWIPALRRIAPHLTNPSALSQWAKRHVERARHPLAEETTTTCAVSDSAGDIYQRLLAIDEEAEPIRSQLLELEAHCQCRSLQTIKAQLRRAKREGAGALSRKQRADQGKVRSVSPEAMSFFLDRRTNPRTRHEPISISIRHTLKQHPDEEVSDAVFYRIAKERVPKAAAMSDDEWRKTFLPGGRWEVPHPNHTHTFDFARADVFAWDGKPDEKPYRPWLTFIMDEHTRSCMFGLYTKEAPSRAILQAVLLHAWLPKADPKWPQCGVPLNLHCDNGKVQTSDWLKDVCGALRSDLNLCREIRFSEAYSPWQQGKVERGFGIVHSHFEGQLGSCYCGGDPQHKPECFEPPSRGIKVWRKYPTLEVLNQAFQVWIVAEYHQMRHDRVKMSRLEYWQLHAAGYVDTPDRGYLHTVLLQRDGTRKVRRGCVEVNTYTYWDARLQGYEERRLEVRSDPADLTRVLVLGSDGQPLCWAERQEKRFVDNPQDLAEHRQQQRATKAMRGAIREAMNVIAPTDEHTFQEHVDALTEAHERQVIPFPVGRREVEPEPTDDALPDEILDTIAGAKSRSADREISRA